ncbi:MAG: HD-GYP domain-containing protein [Lachnospiraceae bacterium]|nr:HD-GYP domain-containing protein [Lachnospiraceae bacterium]
MKQERKNRIIRILEEFLKIGVLFMLTISIVIMGIAFFDTNTKGEAPVGDFSTRDFNYGWRIEGENHLWTTTLPTELDRKPGEMTIMVNTLPSDIGDGMKLMIRSAMEDVYIYVSGEERAVYASERIDGMNYYLPSAYVVADLYRADRGQEVRILIRHKTAGIINGVRIAHGNDAWFSIIENGLPVISAASIVLILGLVLLIAVLFLGRTLSVGAIRQLSLLMINTALWVISESSIRQFIFLRPSLSQYYAYLLVEMIGAFACMYFDEVQHRAYHKAYLVCESLVFFQIIANILLHTSGVMPLYRTILVSHIWTAVCAVVSIVCIIKDILNGRHREYRITMIGMISFVLLALVELAGFYVNRFGVFGTWICIALIVLMTTTVIQTVYDAVNAFAKKEKTQMAMTINTLETISGAIDARDEYTGGHSERVGLYASRLAREMAAEYDLSEEDILRVHYIGLVHDIGKIGVADNVLNKSGLLTEEEFSLMKKHTEIGYEIMSSLGESIDGLLDGIRYHHERFDGRGYPDGLSDTDIPLIARILSIADSYDAMTSNRVYRNRLTDEQVRAEFRRCTGTQFDPALTEIFLGLLEKGELSTYTVNGAAADAVGTVRMSSLLDTRLQQDLLRGVEVESPSHVRMLCYLMKLMEKKGKDYDVFFITREEVPMAPPVMRDFGTSIGTDVGTRETQSILTSQLKDHISPHDVNIRYTAKQSIIALYDRNDEQIEHFFQRLAKVCPHTQVEKLGESVAENSAQK